MALAVTGAVEDFTYQVHSCINDDTGGTVTDAQTTPQSCSWYDTRPNSCGLYDKSGFTAAAMCCACNGGFLQGTDWVSTATPRVEKTPTFSNSDTDGACAVTKTWYGKPSD